MEQRLLNHEIIKEALNKDGRIVSQLILCLFEKNDRFEIAEANSSSYYRDYSIRLDSVKKSPNETIGLVSLLKELKKLNCEIYIAYSKNEEYLYQIIFDKDHRIIGGFILFINEC